MRKKIFITVILVVLILASCQKTDYYQLRLDFENLLNAGNYDMANTLYENAEDDVIEYYNQSLNGFSANLINNAKASTSYEEAKDSLSSFLVFEYTRQAVQQAIDDINMQQQITELSAQNYADGLNMYMSREFENSKELLSQVADFDANYQSAQNMITQIDGRINMWQNAVTNSLTGRTPYVNSLAYKDGYVYFPVDINNIHSIVKHNYVTGETQIFPLVEFAGTFHIKGINVVGNYIYFIAGEELGTGIMIDTPYNIYEMKTDGTELTMVKSGDYFDLICQGSTFYALSYSKGVVMMDNNFQNEEIISGGNIVTMQITANGLYYTEKLKNTHNTNHILYLYKDGASTKILEERMLYVYFFGDYSIYYKDTATKANEEIFVADAFAQNPTRIALLTDSQGDMNGFIGSINNKVMLNTNGWLKSPKGSLRQKIYTEIRIFEKRLDAFQNPNYAPEYEVLNILYEEGVQLVLSADGTYSLTGTPGRNPMNHIVGIPAYDVTTLSDNMSIIGENRPSDEDFYSEEEIIVEHDDFWYYSSPTLNVTIERVYDESVETGIFVANIRTKDLQGFNIGYSNFEAPGVYSKQHKTDDIAKANKAVLALNGDFAMNSTNKWSGKVLRDGKIFDAIGQGIIEYSIESVYDKAVDCADYLVMYPDGVMAGYNEDDNMTYGQLLEAGVRNFLSFGPILVQDSQKTSACTNPTYYLSSGNPRCALGMVEPGHYVCIVADGRQPYVSRGMSFYTLSDYFQKLGCSVAYNLDGGQTAAIAFMGRLLNTHQFDYKYTNHRPVQEIVYFGTSDLVPAELTNYYED